MADIHQYEQQGAGSDNSTATATATATAEAVAQKVPLYCQVAGGGDDDGGKEQTLDYRLGSGRHLQSGAEEEQQPEEEGEEEDEDLAAANPFIDYRPSHLSIGTPHPDPVVETTALSAVRLPEPTYVLAIADEIEQSRVLSSLQLETLVYASQRHLQLLPNGSRAGFFLGDGAGVGKGRTIAGLIWENWQQGRRRALWLSVGSDLRFDARRDLDDVGASCVPLNALNKLSYAKLDSAKMGVKEGVLFLTYNSLIAKSAAAKRTRFQQLEEWCGKDFDGLIVFDECHKAKNLVADGSKKASTQTGRAVRDLQDRLPLARVLYCSATGASEPRNMAYMVRLGLWGLGTSFPSIEAFLQGLERGGVGALELFAMEMKARGMYLCRTLSFKGAEFENVEVDLDPEMKEQYAKMAVLWEKLRLQFAEALELYGGMEESGLTNTAKNEGKGKGKKNEAASSWRMFWASHQRFFRYVCMAAKVPTLVNLAKQVVQGGKCVVIGLQSTGEASTEEVIRKGGTEELDDFVSGPKELLLKLVENHFPVPGMEKTPNAKKDKKDTAKAKNSGRSLFPSKRKRKGEELANAQRNRKHGKTDSCVVAHSELGVSDLIGLSRSGRILRKPQRLHHMKEMDDHESDDDCQDGNSSEYAATDDSSNSKEDTDSAEILESEEIGQDGNDIRIITTGEDHQVEVSSSNVATQAASGTLAKLLQKRAELLAEIQALDLPKNPLDTLIDQLGGPNSVAEMTGRKGLLVRSADKMMVVYRPRGSEEEVTMDMVNMHEKKQFMEGKKLVAIISEAASVGISLQADKRAPNQRRRVHITLELPWSADKAIQQFGRTHRSNQTSAPEYKLLFTNLGGERRFASVVAKRLESLGALTQGDRRAGPSLSAYNYDSVHGKKALAKLYDEIMGKASRDLPVLCQEDTMPPPPQVNMKVGPDQLHNHAREALRSVGIVRSMTSIKKQIRRSPTSRMNGWGQYKPQLSSNEAIADADRHDVGRFLNRLLGLDPDTQNFIFGWFEKIMDKIVKLARMTGDWDSGTKYIKGAHIEVAQEPRNVCVDAESGAQTKLHVLNIDRGLTWEAAKQLLKESCEGQFNGFYRGEGQRSVYTILAIERPGSFPPRFRIYYPHSGAGDSLRLLPLDTLQQANFNKLEYPLAAMEAWTRSYNLSCRQGINIVQKRILSGSILPLWNSVEKALKQERFLKDRILRIVRAETTSGDKKQRLIGVELPPSASSRLLIDLGRY